MIYPGIFRGNESDAKRCSSEAELAVPYVTNRRLNRSSSSHSQIKDRLKNALGTGHVTTCTMKIRGSISPRSGLKFNKVAYVPLPKLRGGGAMICEPEAVTRNTASPRSQVPSLRKRNRPSMPVKPDGLVRTAVLKRCAPCVFTSAAIRATAS